MPINFRTIGPGALVAAAFIGPGTVTVCTLAGVSYGYGLLWALGLATVITMLLQEMSARLGVVGRTSLPQVVWEYGSSRFVRIGGITLILLAIVIGNTAYEAGNISGGAMGVQAMTRDLELGGLPMWPVLIGALAFLILGSGEYKRIEKVLVVLVILMSVSFIIAAFMTKPAWGEVLHGLFSPAIPKGSGLMVVGLIGTTVVPYNLFLHASASQRKWSGAGDLKASRLDTILSIGLGGVVSMAVVICGASVQGSQVNNAADLATGLQPLLGDAAKYFLGVGLFAAGITSAITAPLAAAFVANESLGWKEELNGKRFRLVWVFILVFGTVVSTLDIKPVLVIQFAQVLNGLLLPVVAGILAWAMSRRQVLGSYANRPWQNVAVVLVVAVVMGLGIKAVLAAFGMI